MDIPIPDQIPYTGEEGGPKLEDIDDALHLPRTEINNVWINRRDYSGIPVDFLYEKARIFAEALSMDALESVLTLLIYGQVLFHRCDKIVDRAAIKIFLRKNHVPTLLGDLLHSINARVTKRQGCVLGCIPLLHKWFISHLPRSVIKNEEGLTWIQRIMKLSYDDIIWHQKEFEGIQLFDRCGEFPNVPLLGTRGGITYNPVLARHQFGFALKDKPRSIYLSAENFDYNSDTSGKKSRFIKAWYEVKKVGVRDLGTRTYTPSDLYFRWIYDRVVEFGIPYPSDTPVVPRITPPERLQEVEAEKAVLVANAKERDSMLDYFSRKWNIEDFISPDQIQSWEREIDRLVQEKNEMVKAHKEEIKGLKRKRRLED
ncbi:uncharacterized protein LOC131618697 [Vicia villosa]|uniref:uncharacterized protein LOC131618697 n=1 Tax=Vicia villosa TaxID=3911 RepID=UPI00273C7297|nr:uncharacterized protein LOC131618697 [Vicia villosa]